MKIEVIARKEDENEILHELSNMLCMMNRQKRKTQKNPVEYKITLG